MGKLNWSVIIVGGILIVFWCSIAVALSHGHA